MPGKRITNEQEKLYMSSRQQGHTQTAAAAKAAISERSGRSIESGRRSKSPSARNWRTRANPFAEVWEEELVPLLQQSPGLQAITLLEHLQEKHPDTYSDKQLRTLQRHVKQWKAIHGKEREVMFRQEHPLGRQGFSDFTTLKNVVITIKGKAFKHLLYHFRLASSGWSHVKIIKGGESFTALAEGLQEALWRLGGSPQEHRTDSLSAAFKNLSNDEQNDLTTRYQQLCEYYNMTPTRNNRGVSHENGSIESAHGHVKRRIKQALLLRESNDFESVEAYQSWLDGVINRHNRSNAKTVDLERQHLQPLPVNKTCDYTEVCVRVTTSSTISVRRVTYSVPSRLIGEHLRIHLYDDRLECYLTTTHVLTLSRVYPVGKTERARNIDYRHVIDSLVKKPQAFRFSVLRNDLLPNDTYRSIWAYAEKEIAGKAACKYIVNCLRIAARNDCELELGDTVLLSIKAGQPLALHEIERRFDKNKPAPPAISVTQHELKDYDQFLSMAESRQGKHYG